MWLQCVSATGVSLAVAQNFGAMSALASPRLTGPKPIYRLSASTPSAVQSRSPGRKWNEHGTAVAYLKNCQTDNGIPSPRGKSPTTHYSSSLRYDQFWPCNLVDQRNENKRILKIDACVRTAERVGISSPG